MMHKKNQLRHWQNVKLKTLFSIRTKYVFCLFFFTNLHFQQLVNVLDHLATAGL